MFGKFVFEYGVVSVMVVDDEDVVVVVGGVEY